MKKSLLSLLVVLLCAAAFFTSCASSPETKVPPVEQGTPEEQTEPIVIFEPIPTETAEATLTKTGSRMLWRIDGTDANGNPSTVYLLGTFHFADDDVYPFSPETLAAWYDADRLVAEISSADNEMFVGEGVSEMLVDSQLKAMGHNVIEELSGEARMFFYNTFTPEQRDVFNSFEPWYLSTSISQSLIMAMGMESSYGIDEVLYDMAYEEDRYVEGLDALETQVNILRYGTWEDQLVIAEQSVRELINMQETYNNLMALYSAYVNDEPETMTALLLEDAVDSDETMTEKDKEVLSRYNNAVYTERNSEWAEKIHGYLLDGGTTFIFAGCAHFCGMDSVFDIMKERNYIK